MKPILTPEIITALCSLVEKYGTEIRISQPYICDHCKDADKEAFPYHVKDRDGLFWNDLCNDCFDDLGCRCEDYD